MEVAPFFVDFHHFLSIFTIFYDFHDLRTFVAIYILSRFTHFFRKYFLAKIAFSATSHVFCMYACASAFWPSQTYPCCSVTGASRQETRSCNSKSPWRGGVEDVFPPAVVTLQLKLAPWGFDTCGLVGVRHLAPFATVDDDVLRHNYLLDLPPHWGPWKMLSKNPNPFHPTWIRPPSPPHQWCRCRGRQILQIRFLEKVTDQTIPTFFNISGPSPTMDSSRKVADRMRVWQNVVGWKKSISLQTVFESKSGLSNWSW